jgi:hypothetical protein
MNITNRFNLPITLLNAVKDDEYDRGDSVLSVTQLISSPRIVLLQDLNAGNLTADVVDRVPALLGTAVHKIIEKGSKDIPNHIVEERLFAEILGWKISGAVDLQIDNGDGTWEINDYKVTSVYSVMDEKIEWIQQLNSYAFLMFKTHHRSVTKLKIIAILRDWQRKQAEMKPDYPQSQVVVVDIPVWDYERQAEFVYERVRLHQEAKKMVDSGGAVPYCTDQERWLRGETWAVMKEGRKSAVRLHDSEEEARDTAERLGAGHSVDHRPGSPIRCAGNYCMVAQWCRQYQEELGRSTG